MLPCLQDAIKCLESGHTSSVVSSMLLDFQEKKKKKNRLALDWKNWAQCNASLHWAWTLSLSTCGVLIIQSVQFNKAKQTQLFGSTPAVELKTDKNAGGEKKQKKTKKHDAVVIWMHKANSPSALLHPL